MGKPKRFMYVTVATRMPLLVDVLTAAQGDKRLSYVVSQALEAYFKTEAGQIKAREILSQVDSPIPSPSDLAVGRPGPVAEVVPTAKHEEPAQQGRRAYNMDALLGGGNGR